MDISQLTTFLLPFLPQLLELGDPEPETVTDAIATTSGPTPSLKAAKIWARLSPKLDEKMAAKEAAIDVAKHPNDEDYRTVFRVQLKKIFEQNPDLEWAIAQILHEDANRLSGTQIIQNVTGNKNQVIRQVVGGQVFGNISGSVVFGNASVSPTPTNAQEPLPIKPILILAANPKGTSPLRLSEEVRDIRHGLERSQQRDRFVMTECWAVTSTDVRRALLDCHPHIVHFSGHGIGAEPSDQLTTAEPEGLLFEDNTGKPSLISSEAIAGLFALFGQTSEFPIECVVLNACYSDTQAQAIAHYIPYVIGMKRAIGDKAAIAFSVGFYDAILAGRSIDIAYQFGCNAIQMDGIPEQLTPVLYHYQATVS